MRVDRARRGKARPAGRGKGGSIVLGRSESIEADINNGISPPVVQASIEHAPIEQAPIERPLQTTTNDPSGCGEARSTGRGKARSARRGRGGRNVLGRFESIEAYINNVLSLPILQASIEHAHAEQAPIERALQTTTNDPSGRGKAQSVGRGKAQSARRGRSGSIVLGRFESKEGDINNGISPPVVQAPIEHAPTKQTPIECALQTTTNDPSRRGKARSIGRGKAQKDGQGKARLSGRGKAQLARRGRGGSIVLGRSESIEADINNGVSPSVVQEPFGHAPAEQAPQTTNDLSALDLGNEVLSESQAPTLTNTHHQLRKSTDGRIYLEPYKKSYHPHQAVRDLSRIMKKNFGGPWVKWDVTPPEVKERWFSELKKLYIWEDKFDVEIKRLYESYIAKRRLRSILYCARKTYKEKGIKPAWMSNDHWDELLKKWAEPKYKRQSIINSKNRLSNKDGLGPSCHAGGSIPYSEHKRKYEEMTGIEARPSQLFLMTHKRKGTGNFVDKKSKLVWEKFSSEIKKSLGNTSAAAEDSNYGQANARNVTVEQEVSVWTKVVGGPTKGHIYGFGSDASVIGGEVPVYTPQGSTQAQESSEQVERTGHIIGGEVPEYTPQGSTQAQESLEQVERMRQEVEKGKQERQEMLNELQDLRLMVQQLLVANGIPLPSKSRLPRDPSASSNNH